MQNPAVRPGVLSSLDLIVSRVSRVAVEVLLSNPEVGVVPAKNGRKQVRSLRSE